MNRADCHTNVLAVNGCDTSKAEAYLKCIGDRGTEAATALQTMQQGNASIDDLCGAYDPVYDCIPCSCYNTPDFKEFEDEVLRPAVEPAIDDFARTYGVSGTSADCDFKCAATGLQASILFFVLAFASSMKNLF